MGCQLGGDCFGKRVTVHGQRTACGQLVLFGSGHDDPACRAHFPMQQPNGILFVIIRAEGIGTDHFRQMPRAVGKSGNLWPHFMDDDLDAKVRGLPGGL